jgi:hypothetical protein
MPSQAKSGHCALARANRGFCTDEKRIRAQSAIRADGSLSAQVRVA